MMKLTEEDILNLIREDKWMMNVLKAAESLNLPDWWIGGGFIRSKVWDYMHGYRVRTPVPDIDLIYFDKKDFSEEEGDSYSTKSEDSYQERLGKIFPGVKWSVTNQSRMHNYHQRIPYKNSEEALSEWSETATCIAVRLKNNKLILLAPHGTEDLLNLLVKPIPDYEKVFAFNPGVYRKRIEEKKWLEKWPKLKILTE